MLVDEQFGGTIPETSKQHGLSLTMPAEKSGVNEFQFEYGEDFPAHIEKYDLLATKVLVRYNPDGDAEMNERQTKRLKELADWLHANGRSSSSSCSSRPSRPSWSPSAATPTATTPSCARSSCAA